jgi:hypothetical protein
VKLALLVPDILDEIGDAELVIVLMVHTGCAARAGIVEGHPQARLRPPISTQRPCRCEEHEAAYTCLAGAGDVQHRQDVANWRESATLLRWQTQHETNS